jgi:hypothetical protein
LGYEGLDSYLLDKLLTNKRFEALGILEIVDQISEMKGLGWDTGGIGIVGLFLGWHC